MKIMRTAFVDSIHGPGVGLLVVTEDDKFSAIIVTRLPNRIEVSINDIEGYDDFQALVALVEASNLDKIQAQYNEDNWWETVD
jgi:hypothetical protein